jgi:hypothetical protein
MKKFAPLALVLLLDAILFGSINARTTSSLFLMAGFVLLLATLYYVLRGLLALAGFYGFKVKRPRYLAFYMSGILGCLIALQSIGELGSRDAAVLLPLGLLAYLYTSYGNSSKRLSGSE